jgi:glycosyltransferase involved in cell wall biosynthesis
VVTQPVFLFPRSSISTKMLLNLLDRLNYYGKIWSQNNSTSLYVYIQGSSELEEVLQSRKYDHLSVIALDGNFIQNIFSTTAKVQLKSIDNKSIMLICGDLFLAPVMAKFINLGADNKFSIQISLHGNPTLNNSGFTRFLRKLLLRYAVRISSSIRIVSNHLIDEVLRDFDIVGKDVFVAPIPTQLPSNLVIKDNKRYLAFVGRVHSERNPLEWCEITSGYLSSIESAKAIVIGDGLLIDEVKRRFMPSLRKRINFIGEVEHEDLEKYWPSISILLVTAKSEGFGLTIREALTRGVFVVARENAVTRLMSESYKGIYVYRDVSNALEIIGSLDSRIFEETDRLENVNLVSTENTLSLNHLFRSWV